MTSLDLEQAAARAAKALTRPGAWLDESADGYVVRQGRDRRRRPLMRLCPGGFEALVDSLGLKPREGGGYVLASPLPRPAQAEVGRPGFIEGFRDVVEAGRPNRRRANLGESPLTWLSRRKDADGASLITLRELAAGERLREDVIKAGLIGRLTMNWDAAPRRRGAGGGRFDPVDRAVQAKVRVQKALEAVGPELSPVLQRVCVAESSLDAAERALKLPRRAGRVMLKLALQRLAAHYGL